MSRPGRTPVAEGRATDVRRRTPDVFDARTHAMARIGVPVVLGLVYGYWVAANNRDGGAITGWNLLLGFVSALVFAVVCMALLMLAPRMPREVHALLWTAFVGCAFGFAYSQTDKTVLRSVLMSLVVSGATFIVFFYRYYTREDAFGRRIR
jgi:ABC-type thiamin/hydroxymethylpyrimidine transport system permease subunit